MPIIFVFHNEFRRFHIKAYHFRRPVQTHPSRGAPIRARERLGSGDPQEISIQFAGKIDRRKYLKRLSKTRGEK